MAIMDDVRQLAQSGRANEAIRLVEERAAGSDAEAMFILANWRLWGMYGPKNLDQCHQLLKRSAEGGSSEAAMLRATLINNGTGCRPDPAAARGILEQWRAIVPGAADQLGLLDKMTPTQASSWSEKRLSDDPPIRMIEQLFTPGECDYVLRIAEPELRPSMIIDEATGRPRPHPVRTSSSMNFGPSEEDLVIHALNLRIAAVTGTDPAAGEPLHILRYTPGQEFRPHVDAIAGAPNQRQWTAITYLNEEFAGGETDFPDVGLRVVGRKGDCLLFRNTTEAGDPHPRARHAGLPVSSGMKWVASRWIRQHPYEPEIAGGY